jgi:hypothetical protein
MSFSNRAILTCCVPSLLLSLAVACGGDDEPSAPSDTPDASAEAGGGSGGEGAVGGSGMGGGSSGGSGGTGNAGMPGGGTSGSGGQGASSGDGGGTDCALGCVHGTCVVESGVETCECDATYTGALCDDIDAPPPTGIVLWLDADDDSTTGGGDDAPLVLWTDRSGSGYALIAGPEPEVDAGLDGGADASAPPAPVDAGPPDGATDDIPLLVVNATNGRRVVRFDGNDCMRVRTFAALTDQDAYTIFVVGYGSDEAQTVLSGYTTAGHGLRLETGGTSSYRFLHRMPFGNSGGDNLVSTDVFSQTQLDLVTAWRSTADHALRRAGNAEQTIARTAAAFDEDVTLAIGCLDADSPSRHLLGDIAEILVYSRDLGEPERSAVEDYLSRKWRGSPL